MPVYLVADVKITDESWIPQYAEKVHEMVHRYGGKYLSRSANITPVEGDAPDTSVVALIEFPSLEVVQAFMDDPEYKPFAEMRKSGTVSKLFVVDDTDVAGTIPYLGKG